MPLWIQHLVVLALVASCVAIIARHAWRSLRGVSNFGSCCSKGCGAADAASKGSKVFVPLESIGKPRRP